jgi:7-cyano-7-deazaguanine synthase
MPNRKKAVVLLSGGLDSATTLYLARRKGYAAHCLVFDYGQRHRKEIASAKKIAGAAGRPSTVLKIKLPWQGSSLLDKGLDVPRVTTSQSHNVTGKIPSTYVPGRNIIFLSFALSFAEAIGAKAIFIGANSIDYSGYPDCRPEFYRAFSIAAAKGTKSGAAGQGIKIFTPLVKMSKSRIIKTGKSLGVPYELTWSCYQGGKRPCGVCESCYFRAKGFREAGIFDPLLKKR